MSAGDFTPYVENIGNIFGRNNNWFEIPRYQRDYSWTKEVVETFFDDIISHIACQEGRLIPTSYFLGTILLRGEWDKSHVHFDVVDGQQRLTTTYLLLGALAHRLSQLSEASKNKDPEVSRKSAKLADMIVEQKLKTQEIYESDIKNTLVLQTGNELLEKLVFDVPSSRRSLKANCEAEQYLLDAYDYLYAHLEEKQLEKNLPEGAEYLQRLSVVYEQIMTPKVIIISVTSEDQINEIFEAINSKGSHLKSVDLIKNFVFSHLSPQPRDRAKGQWIAIKDNLTNNKKSQRVRTPWVPLEGYFDLFWKVTQPKSDQKTLYDKFKERYENASSAELERFLELAESYSQVVADMHGFTDYQSFSKTYRMAIRRNLYASVDVLLFKQSFALISALIWASRQKAIRERELCQTLDFLLAFNILHTLTDRSTNRLTNLYYSYARRVFFASTNGKTDGSESVRGIVKEMQADFAEKLPQWDRKALDEAYLRKEKDFQYTNKHKSRVQDMRNVRVGEVLRILFVKSLNDWGVPANFVWNVEHILPDSPTLNSYTHQMGNLLWLERQFNKESGIDEVQDKARHYRNSHNEVVRSLVASGFFDKLDNADEQGRTELIEHRTNDIIWALYQVVDSHRDSPTD
ncbi:DUF262 domain-containing protein [Bifidobacterium aesculapii]|uniref:DUF262 domain-containing protein n=1 Tax=Bifidobacterium aesculapii TaxID=1329411 RepID=UPI000A578EC5|nr:DUF262 domain-containing protein [Bifidobacterium aesculapii]